MNNYVVKEIEFRIKNATIKLEKAIQELNPYKKSTENLETIEDVMISTVLGHTPTELRNIRNMGAKTADEIIEKIGQYLLMHSGYGESNTKEIKNTLAPNYEIIDGIITNVVTQRVVPDVSVYDLSLSIRAGGSLYRGKIRKLSDLIVLTQQQLRNISNLS